MTYNPDDYRARNRDEQVWIECTGEAYNYGLECLPPAFWEGSRFMVGEPSSHTEEGVPTYQPFIKHDGKYYRGKWPMTRTTFKLMTYAQACEGIARSK